MAEQELPYRRQKTPQMRREAAFGVFCLTTVYPTSTHGAHGNSGDKTAGKDVFPSGKGRKCPEISGNRYSGFLWEQDAAGSSPVTRTISNVHNGPEVRYEHSFFHISVPSNSSKSIFKPALCIYKHAYNFCATNHS